MNQPIRLSISEASKLFGINQITIRRTLKEGKLSYVIVRGRYKINFDSVLKWSQESVRTRRKMEENGIGQYVEQWRIKNPLFSPNPKLIASTRGVTREGGPPSSPSSEAMRSDGGEAWQDPKQ